MSLFSRSLLGRINRSAVWDLDYHTSRISLFSRLPLLLSSLFSRYVIHCSFSPDGKYLTSASNDKSIKIWTVTNKGSLRPNYSLFYLHFLKLYLFVICCCHDLKLWFSHSDSLEEAKDEASQVPDKPQQTATTPSLISVYIALCLCCCHHVALMSQFFVSHSHWIMATVAHFLR